jgi:UDP-N-acetylmuramate--alanine ligase
MTVGTSERVDLSVPRRIHIVGVGGAAMGAIATVLAAQGHRVTGSDKADSPALEPLRAAGVAVWVGHDAGHVTDADVVAVSTAVPPDNVEVTAARGRSVPVVSRAAILSAITRLRRTVAVSGTHGKTTTSSMLAVVLLEAGWNPSFVIGGDIAGIGSGAAWRNSEWLVVEADESDGTFLDLDAEAVVVTSVEADHMDHYGSLDNLVAAFDRFLAQAPGPRVAFADGANSSLVAARTGAITYGPADSGADFRVEDLNLGRFHVGFGLVAPDSPPLEIELRVPGAHNAANAAATAATALAMGVGAEAVVAGLARFSGVARRFHLRGEHGGVTFVDDYAHNPGKVRSVLEAAAAGGWPRIVCVFQPHRYTRTATLWRQFADSFVPADVLVITDIYGADETPIEGVSGRLIYDAVSAAHPEAEVVWEPDREALASRLAGILRPGDLCLTLGAGDLNRLAGDMAEGRA